MKISKNTGFTLIELLIVIGIIAVLAALAFVALNPLARFQDSRNADRWAGVSSLISAVKLDQVDNGGAYLTAITNLTAGLYYQIGTGSSCNDTCSNPTVTLQTACADLSGLVSEGYLASIPIDPNATGASAAETRYFFKKSATSATSTIMVGACSEEQGTNSTPDISILR